MTHLKIGNLLSQITAQYMSNLELKNSRFGINGTDTRRYLARPLFIRKGSSVGVNMYCYIAESISQLLFVILLSERILLHSKINPLLPNTRHILKLLSNLHILVNFNDHKMFKKSPQSVVLLVVMHKRAR
jgi:hypothetical protein